MVVQQKGEQKLSICTHFALILVSENTLFLR